MKLKCLLDLKANGVVLLLEYTTESFYYKKKEGRFKYLYLE